MDKWFSILTRVWDELKQGQTKDNIDTMLVELDDIKAHVMEMYHVGTEAADDIAALLQLAYETGQHLLDDPVAARSVQRKGIPSCQTFDDLGTIAARRINQGG